MKNFYTKIRMLKSTLLIAFLLPFCIANGAIRNAPQAPSDITISVLNLTQPTDRTIEFDVYLLDTDALQQFELGGIQLGFLLNSGIYTGGTLSVSINNTGSGLDPAQQFSSTPNVVSVLAGYPNQTMIQLAPRIPPGAGFGTIISTSGDGTLVTHFTLTSTVPWVSGSTPNLTFTSSSPGAPLYSTLVSQYIASVNTTVIITPGVNALVCCNPALNVFTWTGDVSTDWNTAENWSSTTVPTGTDNLTIPVVANQPVIGGSAICNNITIDAGASLTINPVGSLTVNGLLANNAGTTGLQITSDASGTGSLIAGSASGSATVQRYMTTGRWHLVSSPLSGQTVANFLSTNANIPQNGANRGMMDYSSAGNSWNSFFTDGSTNGSLGGSKGFSMRSVADGVVTFTGSLQVGTFSPSTSSGKWNCVGNPYTSAIGITSGSAGTANFLTENAANIDNSFGALYVWDNTDSQNGVSGQYTVINNIPTSGLDYLQQGQAFFVKMNAGVSSVTFSPGMQFHSPGLSLKSAKGAWPLIKLIASVSNLKSSTIIAFNSGMTTGLDPTYDAGLFKGGANFSVYTRLVNDIGIPFAVQALPDYDFESMVIPVGIDSKVGGELMFTSELVNLPLGCKVILEDRMNKSFTDLSKDVYKTTISENTSVTDRFFIHTASSTTGISDGELADNLSAYAVRNVEIRVKGKVSKQAVATLYDVQGKAVVVKNMEEGNLNIIPTPNIKTGIYMLYVRDNAKVQAFKIPVNE